MKKTIIVYTNWDSKRKSGGWSATCSGCTKPVSGKLYATTSDKLALTGLIEGVKEFANDGDSIRLITKNGRVKNAVRHPANSIHCAMAREFRATIKAAGVHYTFG